MKGWLMLWDQPEQPIGAPMQWMTEPMTGHDGMSMAPSSVNPAGGPLMPGMATDQELSKLRSLSGRAFDVFFLQLMLRHHQGGTSMAQYAAAHSTLPALKALVNSMLTSQGAEMDQMKLMLSGRGAQPLPAEDITALHDFQAQVIPKRKVGPENLANLMAEISTRRNCGTGLHGKAQKRSGALSRLCTRVR